MGCHFRGTNQLGTWYFHPSLNPACFVRSSAHIFNHVPRFTKPVGVTIILPKVLAVEIRNDVVFDYVEVATPDELCSLTLAAELTSRFVQILLIKVDMPLLNVGGVTFTLILPLSKQTQAVF